MEQCNYCFMQPSAVGHESVLHALMLASRAFVGLAARSLAAADGEVTLSQFRTLVLLTGEGQQRASDIADQLRVNPSTCTRMLDRLIRKGLVRRLRSATDRRVVLLRLTPAGRDLVDRVMTRRRADLEELVTATSSQWQPAVTQALTAFAAAAGEPAGPDWSLTWNMHAPGDD
jgi:DNA-binding MarR family transcriptional regulator